MSDILGIDTSNYTTSFAVFDSEAGNILQSKKLLPVEKGKKGLRQSDAVFHHTRQIPEVISDLKDKCVFPEAVGVSVRPRPADGSYMPCFLVGEAVAEAVAASTGCKLYKTSHQTGHILAALYSAGMLSLIKEKCDFLAFHVSGGTTDMLLCRYSEENVISIEEIGHSLDLKAGQLIDRVGILLGASFPCGKELEKLAALSNASFHIRPVVKEGNCCLSGVENQCSDMIASGAAPEDVAKFCIDSICSNIEEMTGYAKKRFGDIPVIYAGGVMSDKLIADSITEKFGGYFASPEFSCDNAAGTAIYAAIKEGKI